MVAATTMGIQRLVTLEYDLTVTAFRRYARVLLVHVILQTQHTGEIISHADRTTELLDYTICTDMI